MLRKKRKERFLSDASNKRARDSSSPEYSEFERSSIGSIESISLKNFMCHSHLHLKFTNQVNFIVGRNGSGKSAILTSLIVGLGGKAATASRGNNVKSLVEKGKQTAEVTIQLSNKGPDAYRPTIYGESIIVRRRISHKGASSYRIRSAEGTVVSTRHEELVSILDHFNVQIDNPVMILNQDTSRSFLQSKSPQDKYCLFMKATQLEKLKTDYRKIEEECAGTELEVGRKEKLLPEMEHEVKRYKKQWHYLQSMDDQRHKLEYLQKELIWAKVEQEEAVLQEKAAICRKEMQYIEKLKGKIERTENRVSSRLEEQRMLQQELSDLMKRIQQTIPAISFSRKECLAWKEKLKEWEASIKKIEHQVHRKKKESSILKDKIAELQSLDQSQAAREKEQREKYLAEIEERLRDLHSECRAVENHLEQAKTNETADSQKLHMIRSEQCELKERKAFISSTIRNLQASNQWQRYGANVPKLLHAIEAAIRDKKFKKPPKGPLGSLLKLKDPQWDLATESCLGSVLHAFLCDNDQDSRSLRTIMAQVMGNGKKPPIIVSSYVGKVYDYKSEEVDSSTHISVLENLAIEDPDVINCLIDQRAIEKVALIPTNREARKALMHVETVPKNCWEAFTAQGDQLYPAPSFRYYSSTKNRAELLKVDVDDQIREKSLEIAEIEKRSNELESMFRMDQESLMLHRKESCALSKQLDKLRQEDMNLRSRALELRKIEGLEPTSIATLEHALTELDGELGILEAQANETRRKLSEIRDAFTGATEELRQKEETRNALMESADRAKEKLIEVDSEVQKANSIIVSHREQIVKAEKQCVRVEQEIKSVNKKIEKLIVSAADRISTHKSVAAIINEMEAIKEQLEESLSQVGMLENVESRFMEARAKYEEMKANVCKLREFTNKLHETMNERRKKYCNLCEQTVLRLRLLFSSTLLQQNFTGRLDFDHTKQLLYIQVKPNENSSKLQRDLKALSGGERSFSMVCFVLALWETVECPFRVMDEFDIFMDMGKRRVSMEMILEMTRRRSRSQFVFLTPIELPSISALNSVNIMMMPEPHRSGRQLMQTEDEDS